ncbi:MAG: methyltransferase domain-containing protein [Gemmatimonadaceae bacterium]|nr:methyltransferase domain-containing protein [Gemmatimonadaceae bacterium]
MRLAPLILMFAATAACTRDERIRDAGARGGVDDAGPRTSTVARWPRDTGIVAPLAPPGLPARDFPEPRRPIASIVSPQWSDEAARDAAHEADTVMALLGVRPGMAVADIGAGSGYYVARMARRVGAAGLVYGQDIMPRYLRYLRERVDRDELANVRLALGEPHDPRLPKASLDLVTMIHMYHEIEQPFGLLTNLVPALRPGARIAILDMNRRTDQHGTPSALLKCEFEAVGYTQQSFHDLGVDGYVAIFTAPASVNLQELGAAVRRCDAVAARGP